MTLIWPFKVTKGQTDNSIRSATHDSLLTFYSNYSAISHGNPVFQQMTLIWTFMVTKGQTDNSIRSATYDFLLTLFSNHSAFSHGNPCFSRWPWFDLSRSAKVNVIMPSDYPSLCWRFVPAVTNVLWKIKSMLRRLKNHAWSAKIILFIINYSRYNVQCPHKLIAASFRTTPETSAAGCRTFSCTFYFNLFFYTIPHREKIGN